MGKTQLALSMAAELAIELQNNANAYFIKVGTVDSLREVINRNLMAENVPIVFDEVTVGLMRGTRPSMTLEDVKHLCEIVETTTVDGRNNDISFYKNQPRIFTSNAKSPQLWHRDLPYNVWTDDALSRKTYEPDIKAIFKRVVFAEVPVSLISEERRREHQQSLLGASAASFSSDAVA